MEKLERDNRAMAHLIDSQKKMYNNLMLEATQKQIEAEQAFKMLLYVIEENMKEEGIRIDLGEAEKIDEKSYTITPEAIEDGENKGKLKAITIKRDAGK